MKSLFSILVFLTLLAPGINAQGDSSFSRIRTLNESLQDIAVDNLDNLYLLRASGQLKKVSPQGDSLAVFNDVRRYGPVTQIDVSNPLRVLLYYQNFSTVLILDRFLNVRSTLDLRRSNILQVRAICLAYDNNIWLYDEIENKLKKVDENGKVLMETPDFRLLFGEAPVPESITEQDQLVYLYDKKLGIYVFDYYGALKNKILIQGWDNLRVAGNSIWGTKGDSLYRYRKDLFRVYDQPLPKQFTPFQKLLFTPSRIYVMKKEELGIYNYTD